MIELLMKKMKLSLPGRFRQVLTLLVAVLSLLTASAQTQIIKGTIVDDSGAPVGGATVRVKGGNEITRQKFTDLFYFFI